jgi:two-component system response regulator CpxR
MAGSNEQDGFRRTIAVNDRIKVLMVDDDVQLTGLLGEFLEAEGGFDFVACHDGESGVAAATRNHFDVIILDVMMPKLNGFSALKAIREVSNTPIIMLTARGDDFDRVLGLETGADDYVPKPCSLREIVARIRAIQRRISAAADQAMDGKQLRVGDLRLELGSQSVFHADELVSLTATEFRVLECLVQSAGDVVSKDDIARPALGRRILPYDRSVDAHIVQLRKKLGPLPNGLQRIKTIRGRGYLYVVTE